MMPELAIILGYKCNFKCEHCIVGDKRAERLSEAEKRLLIDTAIKHKTTHVLFIGGEPTLYIDDINDIVARLAGREISFRMTTNGHFAVTKEAAIRTLSSINGLSSVNLSYDNLHAKFLPEKNIKNLYEACREKGLNFFVIMALSSPMDLVLLKRLKEVGDFSVLPQKMLPIGSARVNDVGYKYPFFDEGVLSRFCPNRRVITYMCGQGFTSCCSSMALCAPSRAIHLSVEEHLASEFYSLISNLNFGDMIRSLGVENMQFRPEDSSPCVLCEDIFRAKFGKEL